MPVMLKVDVDAFSQHLSIIVRHCSVMTARLARAAKVTKEIDKKACKG